MTSDIQPDRHVEERLRENTIAWLTTVRPDGQPVNVPVWYVWTGGQILIFSKPGQAKLRNIAANPRVAVTLDDTRGGGDVVSIDGTAEHDPEHPGVHSVPAYAEKYAEGIRSIGFAEAEAMAADYSAAIVVTPTKLRGFHP